MIYEPREDSALLAEQVRRHAKGKVLDMGTGTGIQAKAAKANTRVGSVLAVDINPSAIKHCKETIKETSVTFKTSDLFSKIKGTFDTIIFNPPYLPTEGKNIKFPALEGGRKGWELTERFLRESAEHLNPSGSILLLFSSLTDKRKIETILSEELYLWQELAKENFFYETLYVYKITKRAVRERIETLGVKKLAYFAKGQRGYIHTGTLKGKKVAVKTTNPRSKAVGRIEHEARILKLVNRQGIGPKLITSGKDYLIYEFVKGTLLHDYLPTASEKELAPVLRELLRQCRLLDTMRIEKQEMTRPHKHAIINEDEVILLDFERAVKKERPSNVTQFCQYLRQRSNELRSKGMMIDNNKLEKLARNYKHKPDAQRFKELLDLL